MGNNSGIIVSGGALTADVLAVGSRAKASKSVSAAAERLQDEGQADIQEKLERLLSMLDSHRDKLQDPATAYEITDRVATELGKPKPDKITVKSLITQIVDETKSIAEIATAALALKETVGAFF